MQLTGKTIDEQDRIKYTSHNKQKRGMLMLGIITLLIVLTVQLGFLVYQIATKNRQMRALHILRIAVFVIFALLLAAGVYRWGFRWIGLFALLAILAIFSIIFFLRKPKTDKEYKKSAVILSCVTSCFVMSLCILPSILFPQFTPVTPTGTYSVETTSVTLVDSSRVDPFSKSGENRKLTIQFWYPDMGEGTDTFPLAVFSHGSFGYRGSIYPPLKTPPATGMWSAA